MHTDLETLVIALYVRIDDLLKGSPQWLPRRPAIGIAPKITDSELLVLAVMQALLGVHHEARWVRYARKHLRGLFPHIPKQPGYNKRLRDLAAVFQQVIRALAVETGLWRDPLRVIDSTPVPCGASRPTVQRSALAGWASYGYCASHSRRFWGLRLHLITTVHGLAIAFALTNPKIDEREVMIDLFELEPGMLTHPGGLVLIADKGYRDRRTEDWLAERGVTLVRPAYTNEAARPGRALLRAVRQCIESVNQTFKGQLDLEQHGGRTIEGVAVRVLQRILALTAAIWHNYRTGQPIMRSLIAYDH